MNYTHLPDETAPTLMKRRPVYNFSPFAYLGVLQQFVSDKGYDPKVVKLLADQNLFGLLISQLFLRTEDPDDRGVLWNFLGQSIHEPVALVQVPFYRGLPAQNIDIDRSLAITKRAHFVGSGAASVFVRPGNLVTFLNRLHPKALTTKIAIIGYGAAGILVHHALQQFGFSNVHVFEKSKPLGIWARDHVVKGTRNNPRNISAFGYSLDAAPGSGREVDHFLRNLHRERNSNRETALIKGVSPSSFAHKIVTDKNPDDAYPIVINAIGLGKPKPFIDYQRMVGPKHIPSARWQNPELELADVKGKRFILVGLGNSTAEMIRQLHKFEDQGEDVDFRIITHYPRDAIHNPQDVVVANNQPFRVFRDISKPNLTAFQGDLPDSRQDYYRALMRNRIIPDVRIWAARKTAFHAAQHPQWNPHDMAAIGTKDLEYIRPPSGTHDLHHDSLYVLTGYQHDSESFASMGLSYDDGYPLYDFDGEFIAHHGEDRLHKGYFGFGAVLDAPHNRNTIVIPGMVFRLPDLLFGVIMRAIEYQSLSAGP